MSEVMKYKLPPLPEASNDNRNYGRAGFHATNGPVYTAEQMQAYAIAAIEAQGVPDEWQLVRTDALKMAIDFAVPAMERDRDSPSNSAWMAEAADRNINAVRAMLASAPPAPQADKYVPCPYCGKNTASDNPSQWCPCPKQTSVVQHEPVADIKISGDDFDLGLTDAFAFGRLRLPDGHYLLYTHPAQQPLIDIKRIKTIAQNCSDHDTTDALDKLVAEMHKQASGYGPKLMPQVSGFGQDTPIDMVLHCPACGMQHIDKADPPVEFEPGAAQWNNPPHRSHLCHDCGHIWRPADVPTNGVQAVKTKGKADSPLVGLKAAVVQQEPVAYVCPTSHATADGSMEDGPEYLEWADEASDYEKRVGIPLYTHPAQQAKPQP